VRLPTVCDLPHPGCDSISSFVTFAHDCGYEKWSAVGIFNTVLRLMHVCFMCIYVYICARYCTSLLTVHAFIDFSV
jgi:hypothetical protein